MKPFEIFKPGEHTSSQGQTLTFADADIHAIASGYNPDVHEAPIVIGHPKQDGPAYGWIKSLSVKNGRLVAEAKDIEPAFSELVRAKRFEKRSAAFYQPDSKNNPTPGSYYLRHVGFLGAEAPAVKGLKPVEFADGDDGVVFADLEFGDWQTVWMLDSVTRMLRGIREYFISTSDVETADKIVNQFDLDTLTQTAADMRAQNTLDQTGSLFSENPEGKPDMTTKTQAELDLEQRLADILTREAALRTKETTFSEGQKKTQATADAAFVTSIVEAGRLPIGLKETATALFSDLSDEALTFSEGDQTVSTTPRQAFRDLLGKLPLPVKTGELATGDGPDFSDPHHVAAAITSTIKEAADRGETLSHTAALARLQSKLG